MICYLLEEDVKVSDSKRLPAAQEPAAFLFQPDEKPLAEMTERFPFIRLEQYAMARNSKAERFAGYYAGAISVPQKGSGASKDTFSYYIDENTIAFLNRGGFVNEIITSMLAKGQGKECCSTGQFFYSFVEALIERDSQYFLDMQEKIEELEEACLKGAASDFNNRIMPVRKELLAYFCYYDQLMDLCGKLYSNDNKFFSDVIVISFQRLSEKIDRILDEVKMLREYTVQVRELYQSQIDTRQNNIMRLLTIVTTIFFPLSLIASWYGMNFVNMPEIHWRYGYLAVIIVSVTVVSVCTFIFTKKKFWR